jgi:hypothetical protein
MKTHGLDRISRALGLVIFASGCEILWSEELDKCERTASCEYLRSIGEGGGTATGCVPSENTAVVGDGCGVFVSTSGNDGSAGTKAEPVKTLEEAIARAAEKGTAVYACAEEFAEAAEVPAGVAIFGGLDCASGWTWIGGMKKTTVAPGVEAIPLRLTSGEGTTRIEDVVARAADAQAPGGSSIAVLVDGAKAELARCELVAGNGADGAKGEDAPGAAPMQAPSGNSGSVACSDLDGMGEPDATLPGGALVENQCGAEALSIGGRGGDGNVSIGGGGDDGTPLSSGNGTGGAGESTDTWNCNVGATNGGAGAGDNGTPGDAGLAASGLGALSSTGYVGASGGAGTSGKPGQGGGGGGGAKGGSLLCGGVPGAGASGGSGGAGGCGGLPGQGGGAGGASIALASVQATVTLKDCTLTAGSGGKGGAGGALQPGALGGLPGQGGAGANGSNPGCDGGRGGKGGNGGPGGGGLGGHSLAIAFRGTPVTQQGKMVLTPGAAGAGGPGGSNNAGMNAGAEGIAAATQELP